MSRIIFIGQNSIPRCFTGGIFNQAIQFLFGLYLASPMAELTLEKIELPAISLEWPQDSHEINSNSVVRMFLVRRAKQYITQAIMPLTISAIGNSRSPPVFI